MSINGISGLNAAMQAAQTRTHASGQTPAASSAAASSAAAATASAPGIDAAAGTGTVGALSPAILAALMGQDINLTSGSFGGD